MSENERTKRERANKERANKNERTEKWKNDWNERARLQAILIRSNIITTINETKSLILNQLN
jgi:hypothetical protein